jgi:tetratricopeptide (TPR) repeat protein
VDQWGDARPVYQETVAVYRQLATADPRRYTPRLARTLDNLGVTLSRLERRPDALLVYQETVSVYRHLEGEDARCYRPDLGRTLRNLGDTLAKLGRSADANAVLDEASKLGSAS